MLFCAILGLQIGNWKASGKLGNNSESKCQSTVLKSFVMMEADSLLELRVVKF